MPPSTAVWCARAAGAALVFLLWPALALAQETSTFGTMPSKLKAGNVVIVTDTVGREVRGKVSDVSETSLVILTRDGTGQWMTPNTFTPSNVREVKRTGKIWDKAVLGFGIGWVPQLFANNCTNCFDAEAAWWMAAAGAGIGLAFDAGFGPKRVYLAPGAPRTALTIQPVVEHGRQGALLAFRF